MKKIAILGGTFNPLHNGHLEMAKRVDETGIYDEILFIPTGDPPHKPGVIIADKKHRYEMLRHVIFDNPRYKISDVEILRPGKTYTIDTIKALKKQNPDHHYELIIGADSVMQVTLWYLYKELLKICPLIVLNRPGYQEDEVKGQIQYLTEHFDADILYLHMEDVPISSSMIRACLQEEHEISAFVPPAVVDYVKAYHLYSNITFDEETFEHLELQLKEYINKKRYEHSIFVKETAIYLAKIHHCNTYKAAVAGILHDCAKGLSTDEKFKLCHRHQLEITDIEMKNPELLHAKLGAVLAETQYGIDDQEIKDAIMNHTTGKPGMSLLEKIIFIADYIEPSREKLPRLNLIRELAEKDIDQALLWILEDTLEYLKGRKGHIDPRTEETYRYYKNIDFIKENIARNDFK